jgi:AcrR family transcriptional regulator
MNQQPTKRHILEKTIDAIEKYGLQNLTTRVIADEAGVNNAALHYYYGTKEMLIEQALALTLQHMLEDTGEILSRADSLEERLHALFEYIVEGVLRFPNIIRAHIQEPLMNGKEDTPFMNMLDAWLDQIEAGVEGSLSPDKKRRLHMAAFGTISACLMAGLIPCTPLYTDLSSQGGQEEFIAYLVNSIMQGIRQAD